jgi:hypothetical protein
MLVKKKGKADINNSIDNPTSGNRGSIPGRGERIFPVASVSRPAQGPTQPPVQLVPGVLFLGLTRGRGVTLTTHPSSAEVENE